MVRATAGVGSATSYDCPARAAVQLRLREPRQKPQRGPRRDGQCYASLGPSGSKNRLPPQAPNKAEKPTDPHKSAPGNSLPKTSTGRAFPARPVKEKTDGPNIYFCRPSRHSKRPDSSVKTSESASNRSIVNVSSTEIVCPFPMLSPVRTSVRSSGWLQP